MTVRELTEQHRRVLRASAVPPRWAHEVIGVYSATDPADLPGPLAWVAKQADYLDGDGVFAGGLVFPLARPDGTVVYQFRTDNPEPSDALSRKGFAKYRTEAESGATIIVHPPMQQIADTAGTIMVVEGTKQSLAAARYAPDGVLVVGICGCRNWSEDGVPVPDLMNLARGKAKAVIALDADTRSNQAVFDAGMDLRDALRDIAGVETIVFARPGGASKKAGLDDYLAQIPPDRAGVERTRVIQRLIDNAKPSLGKRPAAPRVTKTNKTEANRPPNGTWQYDVDLTQARMTRQAPGQETDVLLDGAAFKITASYHELAKGDWSPWKVAAITHQIVISERDSDGEVVTAPGEVRNNDLDRVLQIVSQGPFGGRSVSANNRPSKENDLIADCCRRSSTDAPITMVVPELGFALDQWTDPEEPNWRFLLPCGTYGMGATSRKVLGRPPRQEFSKIDLPDSAGWFWPNDEEGVDFTGDPTQFKSIARQTFRDVPALFKDQMRWMHMLAILGCSYLPDRPEVACGVFGPQGSGKTRLTGGLISFLSGQWGTSSPMMRFNATANAIDIGMNGYGDGPAVIDDLVPHKSLKRLQEQAEALDPAIRRSYEGGGKERGKINRDTDSLGVSTPDDAAPLVVITGEELPVNDVAESAISRLLILRLPGRRTMFSSNDGDDGSGNLSAYDAWVTQGQHRIVTSLYLDYIAGLVSATPGVIDKKLDVWRSRNRLERDAIYQQIEADRRVIDVQAEPRAIRSTAHLVHGLGKLLDCMVAAGGMMESSAGKILSRYTSWVIDLMVDQAHSIMRSDVPEWAKLLDRIREAETVSGKLIIGNEDFDTDNIEAGKTMIGYRTTIDDQDAVCLFTSVVGEQMGLGRNAAGQVALIFEKVAICDKNGHPTRRDRWGGRRNTVLPIPAELYDGEKRPAEPTTRSLPF